MEKWVNENQLVRRFSIASKKRGAISGLGVLIAHLRPGTPTTAVSSIKKGIPWGILAERYNTSWFACLRFAIKNMFDAESRSKVVSTLLITIPGKSFITSFESGKDFHVCNEMKVQQIQVLVAFIKLLSWNIWEKDVLLGHTTWLMDLAQQRNGKH